MQSKTDNWSDLNSHKKKFANRTIVSILHFCFLLSLVAPGSFQLSQFLFSAFRFVEVGEHRIKAPGSGSTCRHGLHPPCSAGRENRPYRRILFSSPGRAVQVVVVVMVAVACFMPVKYGFSVFYQAASPFLHTSAFSCKAHFNRWRIHAGARRQSRIALTKMVSGSAA